MRKYVRKNIITETFFVGTRDMLPVETEMLGRHHSRGIDKLGRRARAQFCQRFTTSEKTLLPIRSGTGQRSALANILMWV